MAERILYIFNYQREIPPFMIPQIKEAVKRFDVVRYISPSLNNTEIFDDAQSYGNLEFLTFSSADRLKQYVTGISSVIRPAFWKKIRELGWSKANIKNVAKTYFCIAGINSVCLNRIKADLQRGNKVSIMAAWFDLCAVAAARIKQRNPQIHAESFAHAFEIDAARDDFDYRAYAGFKHTVLDHVHFISHVKLENYYQSHAHRQIKEKFGHKVTVSYLGSKNSEAAHNPDAQTGQPFEIVSCSRTSSEKRLHLLAETLSNWTSDRAVNWTHIGDGPLQDDLKKAVGRLTEANPRVSVALLGAMPNEAIHHYYRTNHVDLFINVSETEGLPVSIMEASSYGIPCAATDVGGTRELVDSSMGWLIDKEFNPADFCRQIETFASLPVEKIRSMRQSAANIWQEKFNADNTIPALWDGFIKRSFNTETSNEHNNTTI